MNFWYRLIFAIWLAPMLWELGWEGDAPAQVRRLARQTSVLLLFIFWWALLCTFVLNRLADVVSGAMLAGLIRWTFLVEQPFDWLFFFCLLVFLTPFARRQLASLAGAPGVADGARRAASMPVVNLRPLD